MRTQKDCKEAALRHLSYRPRTEAELRAHLQKRGFANPCVEQVLAELRDKGLTDDSAFARLWIDSRESSRPRSRAMLRRELTEKGIDAQTISEATGEIDEESSAYRAAQKKARTLATSDYADFRRKLSAFLARRGFGYDVSQRTVKQVWHESGKEG